MKNMERQLFVLKEYSSCIGVIVDTFFLNNNFSDSIYYSVKVSSAKLEFCKKYFLGISSGKMNDIKFLTHLFSSFKDVLMTLKIYI